MYYEFILLFFLEKRESRRLELGFSGPVTPPEILSYLPSATSNHIWLSLVLFNLIMFLCYLIMFLCYLFMIYPFD